MSLAAVQKQYETTIREGMARSLWLSAWMDWAEHPTCRHCGEPITKVGRGDWAHADTEDTDCPYGDGWHEPPEHWAAARSGQDWDDVVPTTPPAAKKAAKDLVKLIVEGEGLSNDPTPMATLFALAMEVDTGEPFEFEPTGKKAPVEGQHTFGGIANRFGGDLAMEAMGHGVGWGDNHKTKRANMVFEPDLPYFEVSYDGDTLSWSGRLRKGGERAYGHEGAGNPRVVITDLGPNGEQEGFLTQDIATGEGGVADAVSIMTEERAYRIEETRQAQTFFEAPQPSTTEWTPNTYYTRTARLPNGDKPTTTYHLQNVYPEVSQQVYERITGHIGKIQIVGDELGFWRHHYVVGFSTGHAMSMVYVNADSIDDALEVIGEWAEIHAPGFLVPEDYVQEVLEEDPDNEEGRLIALDQNRYMDNESVRLIATDPSREQLLEIGDVKYPEENPGRSRRTPKTKKPRVKRGHHPALARH